METAGVGKRVRGRGRRCSIRHSLLSSVAAPAVNAAPVSDADAAAATAAAATAAAPAPLPLGTAASDTAAAAVAAACRRATTACAASDAPLPLLLPLTLPLPLMPLPFPSHYLLQTGDNGVLLLHRPAQQLEAQAHATRAALIQRFAAAADAVQGLRPSSDPQAAAAAAASGATSGAAGAAAPSGGDAAMALDAAALAAAAAAAAVAPAVEEEHVAPELLSVLGLGLQLAGKGLKSVEAGGLREVLLPLLPHLFKLQELAGRCSAL